MSASHVSTPTAKPATLALPKKNAAGVAQISAASGLENKIRERAYQLYKGRGCEPGKDKQDWFQAEHEILKLRP
jgi:Protein of unknown function (DUF2934)